MADRIDEIGAALTRVEEERAAYLRRAGAHDPLPGIPYSHQLTGDPNDVVQIEPGKWRDMWADPKTGLPPGCPVTPIGKDGPKYRFLDTTNQEVVLDAQRGGKMIIESLFAGRHHYLWWGWPRWSKPQRHRDGSTEPSRIIGFDGEAAWSDLMMACALLDGDEIEVRGRGAWRGSSGELIYHAGDCLLVGSKVVPCGQYDGCIYPTRPRIGKPSLRYPPEGAGGPGDMLFEVLRSFEWGRKEHDIDARLTLGWLMTAKIGGALRRRPVLFVHGGEGSGKSTLHELMRLVMVNALVATADATMAGISQHLGQDSIAIFVDELEAREDPRKNEGVLALARKGYSADHMHRGGKDGAGKDYTMRSSFFGSAVNKPATEATDDSRMALLMLRERQAAGDKLEIDAKWAHDCGRDLLKRLFDWWPNWDELERRFRAALIEAGHNDRSADTYAPLAAGCHVALRDTMPEPGEIEDWQRWLDGRKLREIANRERGWFRCFQYLINATPEPWKHNHNKSIGALLLGWRGVWDPQTRSYQGGSTAADDQPSRWLPQVGCQVIWPEGEPQTWQTAMLFVAANHAALNELFAGTSWAGRGGHPGPWADALRQAPEGMLIVNYKCRPGFLRRMSGVAIRIAQALGDDEEEESDAVRDTDAAQR